METASEVGLSLSPPPPAAKFDSEAAVVEFDDDSPPPLKTVDSDDDDDDMEFDGDEEEEEEVELVFDDSDGSEDDDDEEEHFAGGGLPLEAGITAVPDGEFLAPANFAAAGRTAGFMRIAASAAVDQVNSGQEIVVLYRHTLFKRTWREIGVEPNKWRSATTLHRVRFVVPDSGDAATSLPFAGACLSPLIYDEDYADDLDALWSKLTSSSLAIETIPRLQVVVDVGILKHGDDTPERMEFMSRELEAKKDLPWQARLGGMELHLPEPVTVTSRKRKEDDVFDGDGGVVPPARRRRRVIAAGEECPVCLDELDGGAMAWPGCTVAHVFHGRCLETILKGCQICPICRRDLGQTAPSPSLKMDNASHLAAAVEVAVSAAPVWPPSSMTDSDYLEYIDYDVIDDESGDEDDEPTKVREINEPASRDDLPLIPSPFVPKGNSVGPVRFAAAGCSAGFMKISAVAGGGGDAGDGEKDVVVLYRYTRYSRTWSGRRGVEMSRRTKLNRLRFVVPSTAGEVAGSIPWVGSSLPPLIYPYYFTDELRALWSALIGAAPVSIPPDSTRVEIAVDVGILRPHDHSPERMEAMRLELEAKKGAAWIGHHVGVEMNLPEPVLGKRGAGEVDGDVDAPPAKRMRVVEEVAGEECSVCLDELETDLVAWPGCSTAHVFHGECLRMNLERSDNRPVLGKRGSGEVVEEEGDAPPAKRMRVLEEVAGEECPVCFEELDTDLVAWPGVFYCSCLPSFHGDCLRMNVERRGVTSALSAGGIWV
uniref:RING-type E3 ubiquitin transferase n=1 Tax=Leersia perrieri TaxID=77586 RepID=A0A0D9WTF3_9ORYZ